MALPENTSGAVHLTSLSLDISELQKQVDTVEKEMADLAKKAVKAGEEIRGALGGGLGATGTGGKGGSGSTSSGSGSPENTEKKLSVSIKQIADLQKQYANMAKTIESARIDTSEIDGFNTKIGEARSSLDKWREKAKDTKKIVDDDAKAFQQLKLDLTDLQRDFADVATSVTKAQDGFKTGADAVKNLNAQIDKFPKAAGAYADFLKSLDKGKTELSSESEAFQTVRKEAENLVQEITTLNATVASNKAVTKDNLTSLDELNQRYNNLKAQLKQFEQEAVATGVGLKQVSSSIKEIPVSKIEDLNLKYREFLTTLAGSKLSDNQLKQIPKDAQDAASKMLDLTNEVTKNGVVSKEQASLYTELSSTLKTLKGQYADVRTEVNNQARQFQEMNKTISDTIPKLREFEKTATFKNARAEAVALRAEYKTLADNIKAGNLSVGEAQSQLDNLVQRFNDFANHVKTGNTALQNFVDKISESAKWRIANILINQVRQAFSQLFTTITQTEDAVIELRRVLGSQAPANTAMSDELYNIAYEFGQTFDAVQQTAVRFAQTGMDWQETIDATRAAMLALNTAELDTSTATEGLIAVMAQFGIQAEDLEAVIDKINITADNFPVTSENIVAALQRAGGTASAFNMSLEETIATITALSAATGRAGANIGTALNSLISFSMKDSALEKFSEFLGKDVSDYGVLELWTELSKAIHGSGEELATMMSQSEEFSDLMDETLASSIGLEEEYNNALAEQNQMLKDGKDIYSTVGTYRQNYFIALLRNIDTATQALDNMDNAIGYSAQENVTAMEAFNKQWQQLVIALQELAVQFGESGFLDIAKVMTQLLTVIVKVVGAFGGLNTVLGVTAAIMFQVKAVKLESVLTKIGNAGEAVKNVFRSLANSVKNGFTEARMALDVYNAKLAEGATRTEALKAATSTLGASFTSMATLAVTAVLMIYNAYKQLQQKQEEIRKENIAAGEEAKESFNTLYTAVKNLNEARDSGSLTKYKDAQVEVIKALGFEKDDVNTLEAQYGTLSKAIEHYIDVRYQQMKVDAEVGARDALKQAKEDIKDEIPFYDAFQYVRGGLDSLATLTAQVKEAGGSVGELYWELENLRNVSGPEEAQKKLEMVSKWVKILQDNMTSEQLKNDYLYDYLTTAQKALNKFVKAVEPAIEFAKLLGIDFWETSEKVDEATDKTEDALNRSAKAAINATMSYEELTPKIEALSTAYDDLNKRVDTFQSSYKTLENVVKEYNETGLMTADMMQSLLELDPEYIDLLVQEGDKLSINEEKLRTLMETNAEYMVQLQAMKIAKEAEAMASDLQRVQLGLLTEEEFNAKYMMSQLKDEVANAAYAFLTGKDDGNKLTNALKDMATQLGLTAQQAGILTGNILGLSNSYKTLIASQRLAQSPTVEGLTKADTLVQFRHGKFDKKELDRRLALFASGKYDSNGMSTQEMRDFFFGTTTAGKGGASSSSTKKTVADVLDEKAKNAISSLKEMMSVYEHTIDLIGRNRGDDEKLKNVPFFSDFGGKGENYIESQVAIYREMQKQTHELANQFREMGFGEESEYIRELQELHWSYHDAIIDLYQDMYDQQIDEHENMIDELSYQYDQLEKAQDFSGMTDNLSKQIGEQKAIQEAALKEYTKLLEVGVDKNDDAVQSALQTIRDAANEIQTINDKIKENVLGAYDDFISAADKFDLWDNLDFTKVDYLQRKMQAINQLFRDGTITLQEYNNQLREMTEAMYDAQIEQFQKEQEETQKYYDDLIDKRKEDIETLKKQKDETKDYYDTIIDGYKEEIKQWEERKDEVTKYYDELIDALNEVQEDNDRINRQIDYYNSRQKIITNLEQAQARSGVEWREKEMEYQQQLIELDEEWNRTRQEWSIADQIEELNKLRDAALADIDASIERINENIEVVEQQSTNAINNIESEIASIEDVIDDLEKQSEAAIDRIEERIKDLSKQIADAFSSASMNGMMNTTQAINNAFANAGSKLFGGGMTSLGTGLGTSLSGYGGGLTSSLVNSAQTASQKALEALKTNFVNPALPLFGTLGVALGTALSTGIKNANIGSNTRTLLSSGKGLSSSIRNVMNSATAPTSSNISSIMARNTSLANAATNSLKTGSGNATIYVTNNVNSVDSAADKTNNIIQNLGI